MKAYVIPVGDVDYRNFVFSLGVSIDVRDNGYRTLRYYDALQEFRTGKELDPVWIPATSIRLEDKSEFTIIVSSPIIERDEVTLTPWSDELMPYEEAKWQAIDKILNRHYADIAVVYWDRVKVKDAQDAVIKCREIGVPVMLIEKGGRVSYEILQAYRARS